MTLSGTYLSRYPFTNIKKYKLDKYPTEEENLKLIKSIKNKYKLYNEEYSIIIGAGTNGLIQNICKSCCNNSQIVFIRSRNDFF